MMPASAGLGVAPCSDRLVPLNPCAHRACIQLYKLIDLSLVYSVVSRLQG